MAATAAGRRIARKRRADPPRGGARSAPRSAGPARAGIDRLQRTLGNAGVSRLLQARAVMRACAACEEEEIQAKGASDDRPAVSAEVESYVDQSRRGGEALSSTSSGSVMALPAARAPQAQRSGPPRAAMRPVPRGAGPAHLGIKRLQRSLGNAGMSRLLGSARRSTLRLRRLCSECEQDEGHQADAPPAVTHVRQQTGTELIIRTQPDDSAGIGTAIEPLEVADWKAELKKQGYTEFHSKADGFKGWAKDAFPDGRQRPDLIAVDHKGQRVLVGDVTGGPGSESDVKPGDRRPLPNDLGEADPHRSPKRRHKPQKQAHGSKTKADARQAARNLPSTMQGYEVAAEEKYWNAKAKTSGRFVVQKKAPATAPAPKAGTAKGARQSGVGSGKAGGAGKTPKARIGKAAKSAGRGLKALGRGAGKVLTVFAVLGPLFKVSDALASFNAAKAKVDELKRILDAAWAQYEKMVKNAGGSAPSGPTAPVRQPVQQPTPEPPRPEPVSRKESVRVYDILKQRLRERSLEVETDRLKTSYTPVSFTSLTDIDTYTLKIPSHQYDCPDVLKRGIGGVRQAHKFDGYATHNEYRRLKDLLSTQLKAVRLLCAARALGEKAGKGEEPAAKPDGDEITVYLDWVEGELSDSISATCQGPDGSGNWACSHDGDFASLKRVTQEEEPPDHQLAAELTRSAGGQQSTWTFTLSLNTPDPENPEPSVVYDGSLPEGACDPDRYPKSSGLAFILEHYGSGCR